MNKGRIFFLGFILLTLHQRASSQNTVSVSIRRELLSDLITRIEDSFTTKKAGSYNMVALSKFYDHYQVRSGTLGHDISIGQPLMDTSLFIYLDTLNHGLRKREYFDYEENNALRHSMIESELFARSIRYHAADERLFIEIGTPIQGWRNIDLFVFRPLLKRSSGGDSYLKYTSPFLDIPVFLYHSIKNGQTNIYHLLVRYSLCTQIPEHCMGASFVSFNKL